MKRKKPSNLSNAWSARQQAIESADGLMAKARVMGDHEVSDPKQARAVRMKAALFLEAAAQAYLRASLGAAARQAWTLAKDCYVQLDHKAGVIRCERQQSTVPTYLDDESPPDDCP